MPSVADICNLALSHIGDEAEVITISPPDGSIQAKQCARFYPLVLNLMLEAHPWTWAIKRLALPEVTNPTDKWSYAYSVPADNVRPLAVLRAEYPDDADSEPYIVETDSTGKVILYTNVETATLRYIYRVNDPTKFTPGFTSAFARLLASYLAGPIIKGSEGMQVSQGQWKIWAGVEMPQAKAADSNVGHRNQYRDFAPGGVRARQGWSGQYAYDPLYPYRP